MNERRDRHDGQSALYGLFVSLGFIGRWCDTESIIVFYTACFWFAGILHGLGWGIAGGIIVLCSDVYVL